MVTSQGDEYYFLIILFGQQRGLCLNMSSVAS